MLQGISYILCVARGDENMSIQILKSESDESKVFALGKCVLTGQEYQTADFDYQKYLEYRNGAYIQDALASMAPHDREFLISGICPDGWEQMWDEERDVEYEDY